MVFIIMHRMMHHFSTTSIQVYSGDIVKTRNFTHSQNENNDTTSAALFDVINSEMITLIHMDYKSKTQVGTNLSA